MTMEEITEQKRSVRRLDASIWLVGGARPLLLMYLVFPSIVLGMWLEVVSTTVLLKSGAFVQALAPSLLQKISQDFWMFFGFKFASLSVYFLGIRQAAFFTGEGDGRFDRFFVAILFASVILSWLPGLHNLYLGWTL